MNGKTDKQSGIWTDGTEKMLMKYQETVKKYQKLERFLQAVFLFLLMMNIFGRFLGITTYGYYFSGTIADVAMRLLLFVVVVRVFFLFQYREECVKAFLYAIALLIMHHFYGTSLYTNLIVIMIGSIGIEYRKILKAFVITVGTAMAFTIFVTLTGATNHLVYLWDGGKIRDSFGICYPTDFASCVFFLLVFFWIAWEKLPLWISVLLNLMTIYIVNVYALSDTCTICCIAFFAVLFVFLLAKYLINENSKLMKFRGILDFLLTVAFPCFAGLMFLMTFLYAQGIPFMDKINSWLTGRLALNVNAFRKYGISLWGTSIRQAGNGFTTFPVSGYEFVDSSYPLILLNDGLLFFMFISYLWARMSWRAAKRKDYRLAFGMGLIALHALAEHHFTELNYNILLFLPLASCPECKPEDGGKEVQSKMRYLGTLGAMLFFLLTAPLWISLARTINGWRRFLRDGNEMLFAFVTFVLLALTLIMFIRGIWSDSDSRKKKKRKIDWGISAGALLILIAYAAITLNAAGKDTNNGLKNDQDVLERIDHAAQGNLYSTEAEWLMKKTLHKMRFSVMTGEDLGRKKNATVIVPRGTEYYILTNKGFSYAAISEDTAVYTCDTRVLEMLRQEGIQTYAYYNDKEYVELPIRNAELVYLRSGTYHIIYRLQLKVTEMSEDVSPEVFIVGDSGAITLVRENVNLREADENGMIMHTIDLVLDQDTPGIKFYLLGTVDGVLEVQEVSYQRIAK